MSETRNVSSDLEFRDYVVSTLSRMDANLKRAIGDDGNGGQLKDHDDRLDKIEQERAKEAGERTARRRVAAIGYSMTGGLFGALIQWLASRR